MPSFLRYLIHQDTPSIQTDNILCLRSASDTADVFKKHIIASLCYLVLTLLEKNLKTAMQPVEKGLPCNTDLLTGF
jgi:hypothetical protein